ncbi:hypothetical protein YBT020_14350 [Bacillus thuringiensis serovar finitimus YBT-020]|nr:hypothetical protein YBT020_14350 [Bacillus thuringiensis serovar finitimus YBT-020]
MDHQLIKGIPFSTLEYTKAISLLKVGYMKNKRNQDL